PLSASPSLYTLSAVRVVGAVPRGSGTGALPEAHTIVPGSSMAIARPATTLRHVAAVAFMRSLWIPMMCPSAFIRLLLMALARIEEREELLLLGGTQPAEVSRDARSLAAVAPDRVLQRQRLEIVHIPWPHAQAPQGRRPQFVGRVLWRILDDAVP